MSHELSPTLCLCNDKELNIDIAFEFFSTNLNDPNHRLRLFGKQVYYEAYEMLESKIVGFWHLISTKLINLTSLPCNNDIVRKQCDDNCIKLSRMVEIKNEKETRVVCLYRASHLPWIMDVIKLANEKNVNIQCWQLIDNNNRKKLYVRYKYATVDYVLILSDQNKIYRLLTAYPVFLQREKRKFDRDYSNYKWEYSI